MLKNFYPGDTAASTYDIDFRKLYKEGKRGILFDIDNTLVEHDADSDERSEALFAMLHRLGFKTCLISNNDEERVKRFNKNIGTDYVFKAGKPKARGYLKGVSLMGLQPEQVVFIGDQLFTDIWGANMAGLDSICVKPLAKHEEIQIVLKRKAEKLVYIGYNRHIKKKKKENNKNEKK